MHLDQSYSSPASSVAPFSSAFALATVSLTGLGVLGAEVSPTILTNGPSAQTIEQKFDFKSGGTDKEFGRYFTTNLSSGWSGVFTNDASRFGSGLYLVKASGTKGGGISFFSKQLDGEVMFGATIKIEESLLASGIGFRGEEVPGKGRPTARIYTTPFGEDNHPAIYYSQQGGGLPQINGELFNLDKAKPGEAITFYGIRKADGRVMIGYGKLGSQISLDTNQPVRFVNITNPKLRPTIEGSVTVELFAVDEYSGTHDPDAAKVGDAAFFEELQINAKMPLTVGKP